MRWVEMETPGHWSLAFGWERRRFALALARLLAAAATGEEVDLLAGQSSACASCCDRGTTTRTIDPA